MNASEQVVGVAARWVRKWVKPLAVAGMLGLSVLGASPVDAATLTQGSTGTGVSSAPVVNVAARSGRRTGSQGRHRGHHSRNHRRGNRGNVAHRRHHRGHRGMYAHRGHRHGRSHVTRTTRTSLTA
jgi:hypothetical protein